MGGAVGEEEEEGRDLSATFFASSGCEFPVSSLIEFEVIAGPYQCEGGVECLGRIYRVRDAGWRGSLWC